MNTTTLLQSYAIDLELGFLSRGPFPQRLPEPFAPWEDLAERFTGLLHAYAFRKEADQLPVLTVADLHDEALLERAMLLMSCFGHGYVFEGDSPSGRLPQSIARPWDESGEKLGRPPVITHASLVLNNYALIDPSGKVELGNITTLMSFTGSMDEAWFFLVTAEIEAIGAKALPILIDALQAAVDEDAQKLEEQLMQLPPILEDIRSCFLRMYERCDPYIFYTRVRPFLASMVNVKYEGTAPLVRNYHGGSAAQSSLLQAFDAALGVRHEGSPGKYLMKMREHMPPKHRQFLEYLEGNSTIAVFCEQDSKLRSLRNIALDVLRQLRADHLKVVHDYIVRQGEGKGPGQTGTGGTDPQKFLKDVMDKTQ